MYITLQVSREDSSAATTTRRKSSEVESKQRKDRSTKGHLKELPQRKIYLDSVSTTVGDILQHEHACTCNTLVLVSNHCCRTPLMTHT